MQKKMVWFILKKTPKPNYEPNPAKVTGNNFMVRYLYQVRSIFHIVYWNLYLWTFQWERVI